MFKRIDCCLVFLLFIANSINSQKPQSFDREALLKNHPELQKLSYSSRMKQMKLSPEATELLEGKGFRLIGQTNRMISPHKDTLCDDKRLMRVNVSLDLKNSVYSPINPKSQDNSFITTESTDTIMTEDFEGEFPGTKWQRSGDPTWGKSNYTQHKGNNSLWCAKDGTNGIEPGANYPINCHSMIIYGPFDLSDVNYAQLKFWYLIDTEYEKDWFFFMASKDGNNFQGIGISGESGTGYWDEDLLHLNNVAGLGNATGHQQVWIAFLFESDNNSTSDKGVYIDDLQLNKRQINGTPIAGAMSGEFTASGNPYVAVGDFGVAEGDTLEIKPGVEIRAEDGVEFTVLGLLKAIGTPSDTILFTSAKANPSPGDWGGIGLYDVASKDCRIQYCRIEYSGLYEGGIYADTKEAEISNCLIWKNNKAGISCGNVVPGSTIKNCRILKNYDGVYGILSSTIITNNLIAENVNGIVAGLFSSFYIKDNIIENNREEGVLASVSAPIVVHNTIRNNGLDGIRISGNLGYGGIRLVSVDNLIMNNGEDGILIGSLVESASIINNIIKANKRNGLSYANQLSEGIMTIQNNTITQNNSSGIECNGGFAYNSDIINNIISDNLKSGIHFQGFKSSFIRYNDFYNNNPDFDVPITDSLGILSQTNTSGNLCDAYFNISLSPLFENASANNFQLQQSSPCRNAGDPSVFFNDIDGSVNDMGAYGGSFLYVNFPRYDFGAVVTKDFREVVLRIENNRSNSFTISSLQLSDMINFSISQSVPISLSPYEQKSITVTFRPQSVGNYSAILTISCNGFFGTDSASVILSGKGINGTSVKGNVSGTWTRSGSPYILSGNIEVSKGNKLIIEPGVEIRFNGHYFFVVWGKLQATGTENAPIVFTKHRDSEDSEGEGIRFHSESLADTSKLIYCVIEKMTHRDELWGTSESKAISIFRSSPVLICHSRISNNNGPAIDIESSTLIIENSIITNNRGNALNFVESQAEINSCDIRNNEGIGINSHWGTGKHINIRNSIIGENQAGGLHLIYTVANLYNNLIIKNSARQGGGIFFNSDSLVLINNTIIGNIASERGGGLYREYSPVVVMNNIIRNNIAPSNPQIYNYYSGTLAVSYSNVQGGWSGEGNIDSDPLFADSLNYDFHLQINSPCIDKGNPESIYNDPEDPNNPGYSLLPTLGTIRNDMGAYGGLYAASWDITTFNVPSAPELLFPCDKDTIVDNNLNLTWHASNLATSYHLQLSHFQDFSSVVISKKSISDTSYGVTNLENGTIYYWRVKSFNTFSNSPWSNVWSFITASPVNLWHLNNEIKKEFSLWNYPNPFNSQTKIKYELPKNSFVTVKVFNVIGKEINTLVKQNQVVGNYEIMFDGRDLPSGIYFYRLQAGDYSETRKMILLK